MKLRHTYNQKGSSSPKIVWDSLAGPRHKANEDKVFHFNNECYALLGVFDGVGSAKNNALATELASHFISEKHHTYYSNHEFHLEDMVIELNKTILSQSDNDMSALTTCAICVYIFSSNKLIFLTLGDTRIYAVGKHYATKLTQDDVIHPGSNIITKCLGLDLGENQIAENIIEKFNDNILICSDGFYNLFEETKLDFFDALSKSRTTTIKNNLYNLVADKNTDDASYVLFKNV